MDAERPCLRYNPASKIRWSVLLVSICVICGSHKLYKNINNNRGVGEESGRAWSDSASSAPSASSASAFAFVFPVHR